MGQQPDREGGRFADRVLSDSQITETQTVSCRRMRAMSSTDELNQRLRTLDAEFDREMRTRGFDPAQAENVALPSHLATLYARREQIRAELRELEGKTDD